PRSYSKQCTWSRVGGKLLAGFANMAMARARAPGSHLISHPLSASPDQRLGHERRNSLSHKILRISVHQSTSCKCLWNRDLQKVSASPPDPQFRAGERPAQSWSVILPSCPTLAFTDNVHTDAGVLTIPTALDGFFASR